MERPGMRRIPGRLWRTLLAAAALAAPVGAFLAWGPIGLGNGPLSVGGGADYGPDPKLAPLAVLDPVEAGGTGAVIDSVALVGGSYPAPRDRKSTRLNSSHVRISYAVFCLKKKKK